MRAASPAAATGIGIPVDAGTSAGRSVARDLLIAPDDHVALKFRLALACAVKGLADHTALQIDKRRDDVGNASGLQGGFLPRLDGRVVTGLDRPAFSRLRPHVLRRQRHHPLFLVDADFHAILKVDDKFIQGGFGRGHAAAPADVRDKGIVRVAVVIAQIAQRARDGRADHAPIRAAPQHGQGHARHYGFLRVRAFVVPQRLHVAKVFPGTFVHGHHLGFFGHAVVMPQVGHGQFHQPPYCPHNIPLSLFFVHPKAILYPCRS